jgi:hypothetical protein
VTKLPKRDWNKLKKRVSLLGARKAVRMSRFPKLVKLVNQAPAAQGPSPEAQDPARNHSPENPTSPTTELLGATPPLDEEQTAVAKLSVHVKLYSVLHEATG